MTSDVSLAGRWTVAQVRALQDAGWITLKTHHYLIDVTTFADTCEWFIICPVDPCPELVAWAMAANALVGH